VFGGDVIRLYHGDECLTIPAHDVESVQRFVANLYRVRDAKPDHIWKFATRVYDGTERLSTY